MGTYSITDLISYLRIWSDKLCGLNFSFPVSIVMQNMLHAITVGYDPTYQQWSFANSTAMPIEITDMETLANKINRAFSDNDVTVFKSSFYASVKDRKKVRTFIQTLLNHADWNRMHAFSFEKIKLETLFSTTTLFFRHYTTDKFERDLDNNGHPIPVYQDRR